uniref:Calponin family repeat-containing domain protein n=1 Tax=Wuchereria bancrofti TaxID=6293 RepID=A0AAF5PKG9_WUCBA
MQFSKKFSREGNVENEQKPTKRKWNLEQLRAGDTFLSVQAATNKYDSQKGMTAPGMPRWNVVKDKHLGFINPDRKGEELLRPQYGSNQYASQKGLTPIGASRSQVLKVEYKKDWEVILDKQSEKVIPKQSGDYGMATQSGERSMGSQRNQVPIIRGRLPRDRRTNGVLCYQYGTNIFASQQGMNAPPGIGAVRQATMEIEGLGFTEDGLRKGSAFTPWYSGQNKFASQSGTGGFLKVRDVLPNSKGGKEIDEVLRIKSEGIVPLQAGTNKFASQRGMTGFGTRRNVLLKQGWKKEWINEYEQALREFEETRPPGLASVAHSSHYKQEFKERRETEEVETEQEMEEKKNNMEEETMKKSIEDEEEEKENEKEEDEEEEDEVEENDDDEGEMEEEDKEE